jgi:IMP dehydrogenase
MGTLQNKIIEEGITFDDVLLLPRRSGILPAEADLRTRLTRNIILNIPLISAPMDTVTEASLAIALAQEGGIGIIHKNLPIEVQAGEVEKVKRSASGVITDPVTLGPSQTVGDAYNAMRRFGVSGFPIVEGGESGTRNKGKLLGILTRRDLKFIDDDNTLVRDLMTSQNLVTASPDTTLDDANRILNTNKVEKLLLVESDGTLCGLITVRDIDRLSQYPDACVDGLGRLRCGAAVGVMQYERVEALVRAGVDVIVVDTAHGHSENVLNTVRQIKKDHEIDVIAGNVGTKQGALDLIEAGADAVKVGIGPGSICTTRVVTGVGVPQISAVMHAVEAAEGKDVPVIADGGIRMSGDIAKAIAAGASTVMMGSLFAGLDESPGELVISQGRRYKSYRGMGSEGAMGAGSADRYGQGKRLTGEEPPKFVPEGVEGLVSYRGALAEYVFQLVGGLRAAMGYCGCKTVERFRADAQFCRITGASMVESHPHDIRITKESPNYTAELVARV